MVVQEDRFGEDWEGALLECLQCACCFLGEPPNAEALSGFYQRCYGHYEELLNPGTVRYKWFLDRLGLKRLLRLGEPSLLSTRGIRGPRVLDFGCHDGSLLRALEPMGYEAYGYEPHPASGAKSAKILTGTVENLIAQLEPVDDIVLSQVLEHLLEPAATLRQLRPLL